VLQSGFSLLSSFTGSLGLVLRSPLGYRADARFRFLPLDLQSTTALLLLPGSLLLLLHPAGLLCGAL
jgi:hypothetical protein